MDVTRPISDENTAMATADCRFASPPTRQFNNIYRSRPFGYWTMRQCLQIQSLVNFIRFLIATTLKSRIHFIRGQLEDGRSGLEAFQHLISMSSRIVRHVEQHVEKTVLDHGSSLRQNLYLTFEHDLGLCRGFLFDSARELALTDEDVTSLFPGRMQIIVSAFSVHYAYNSNCFSCLLDKQQRTPWVPDMIDRTHREEDLLNGCNSLTNSCREAKHARRDGAYMRNQRCPRAVSQEEVNWMYDRLGVHLLGSTAGGQTLDTAGFTRLIDLNRVMAEELKKLRPLVNDNCTCRRCDDHVTFPMRVPLHFLDLPTPRPSSPPTTPALKRIRRLQQLPESPTSPPPSNAAVTQIRLETSSLPLQHWESSSENLV